MLSSRLARLGAVALTLGSVVVATSVAESGTAGAARIKTHKSHPGASVTPVTVKGGGNYSHPPPSSTDHDQGGPLKLRKGKGPALSENGSTGIASPGNDSRIHPDVASIDLVTNTPSAVPTDNTPAEPNEASDGQVVVYTTNEYVGFSVNGGASFKSFNPGSLYSDDPDGGVCCDQIVQYSPAINRFIWLDQYWPGTNGANRYRLAVFPPSAVSSNGLISWTYWDITAASFPALKGPFLDFPELSLGKSYLYLSADNGKGGSVNASVIARIGLTNLEDGSNLAASPEPWRYVNGALFFGRVAQNTGSTAYWAQNTTTSQIGVSYWPESGTSWFGPVKINVDLWPNSNYTTTTPDGDKWLSTYTGTILDAAVTPGANGEPANLWLAWTAGIGTGNLSWLSQPNVQLVDVGLTGLTFVSQRAIWNSGYAFAYPNLNVSQAGDLGIVVAWGGDGNWVNTAVGDLSVASNTLWNITNSSASEGQNRWGDYVDIRPAYNEKGVAFTAAGYGINAVSGGYVYDPHFAAFTISP